MSVAAQLLLALSAPQPDEEKIRAISADPRLAWEDFFALAQRHRMVGLAAPLLRKTLDGDFPRETLAPWIKKWENLALQDLRQMVALEEIFSAASKQGIALLLLKGLSVHLQAYVSQETARGAGDIDLMVWPSQIFAMKECLEGLGFVFRGTDSWSRPVSSWSRLVARDSEALFLRAHPPVSVDLHWRLCDPALERACHITLSARIWHRTRTLQSGGISCLVPGREEEMLMLCLHLFKGGTVVLRNLSDVAGLLRADPPLDWDLFLQIGKETGTIGCVYYAMRLVSELSAGIVPEPVWPVLRGSAGPSLILAPSLGMRRLLKGRGEGLTDLSIFWNGVLFARHPVRWFPYETGRVLRWMARRVKGVLR